MPSKGQLAGAAGAALLAIMAPILADTYQHEGGYVNDPADPGGATRFGVTEQVARRAGYVGDMRDFPKKCLKVEGVCADSIYIDSYVVAPGYAPMAWAEPAVLGELFDSAVNFGPARPSGWFQQSLNEICGSGLTVDRKVGARTNGAYRDCQARKGRTPLCIAMLGSMDGKQRGEYDRLVRVNPRLRKFHRGWIRLRIGNVDRADCSKPLPPPLTTPPALKAPWWQA